MTQEEKELVLTDLCARTKFRPIIYVEIFDINTGKFLDTYDWPLLEVCYFDDKLILSQEQEINLWTKHRVVKIGYGKDIIKPYLRLMETMTEAEKRKFNMLSMSRLLPDGFGKDIQMYSLKCFDWLNKYHFDYRGLIEKGLALEAPPDMYKI